MKNKIFILCIAFFLVLPMQTLMAFAEPYQRKVVITGYYSPIPGQQYYVKGSIEADKRLNGNGTHGASGRPVFRGMIAAPKDYPFGTKIYIPGLGVGTVADRGGAIISNYKDRVYCESGNTEECDRIDRLDIWMGHGDEGLARALYQIGVKRATATIYPPGTEVVDSIFFADVDAGRLPKGTYKPSQVAISGIDDSVKKDAQQALKILGFHDGSEENFEEDVYRFQQKYGVIMNKSEAGAGHLGPKTREVLKEKLNEFYASVENQVPKNNMGKGSSGAEVKALQETLKTLGHYSGEITGIYDKNTIEAVYKFQDVSKLISDTKDSGAGYFGPKTRDTLKEAFELHERITRKSAMDSELPRKTVAVSEHTGSDVEELEALLKKDIEKYDQGDGVLKLQEYLNKLGYLNHEPTGYYGELTSEAVLEFQKAHSIVSGDKEVGAGRLGPATRAKLASLIQETSKPKVIRQIQATSIVGVAKRPQAKVETASSPAPEKI